MISISTLIIFDLTKIVFFFTFGCRWFKKVKNQFSFLFNLIDFDVTIEVFKISISSFYFPINIVALQMQLYPISPLLEPIPISELCNFSSLKKSWKAYNKFQIFFNFWATKFP
jgi:hypothetical protein